MVLTNMKRARSSALRSLGLKEDIRPDDPDVLRSLLYRALAHWTPCPRRVLLGRVAKTWLPLFGANSLDLIDDALDQIVSCGDALEVLTTGTTSGRPISMLFLAPPQFVEISDHEIVVIGINPFVDDSLPPEIEERMERRGIVNVLAVHPGDRLPEILEQQGLIRTSESDWLRLPAKRNPKAILDELDDRLDSQGIAGSLEGLTIVDPARDVSYYRGRWISGDDQSGRFVGRRPRQYGSDIWCYVSLSVEGNRVLDLPFGYQQSEGRDEAWYALLAQDSVKGHPQIATIEQIDSDTAIMLLYSPVPGWAERRWSIVGRKTNPKGALFGYIFDVEQALTEAIFAEEYLWLHVQGIG